MVVAARQTDSGHHSVEEADMLAELPARIADMEGQIRILRDTNKRKFLSTVCLNIYIAIALLLCLILEPAPLAFKGEELGIEK